MSIVNIFASSSAEHSIAIASDLRLLGSGSNAANELAMRPLMFTRSFRPILRDILAPVVDVSVSGFNSIVATDPSLERPSPTILRPQCEIQGCSCPAPLADAICVDTKWTAPNIIIWENTTIGVSVEIIGNLTLAPHSSLTLPIGSVLHIKGCAQFYGGNIIFTTTPEQLLQHSTTPLVFLNTTCGVGSPGIVLNVINGAQDECNSVSVDSVEHSPVGYFVVFSRSSCDKKSSNKLWIIGVVIGAVFGLVILVLILVFFVRPIRLIVFPFYARRIKKKQSERASLNSNQATEPGSAR